MDFSTISLLFSFAAISAFAAHKLKQPLLIGYLVAGFLLGYIGLIGDMEMFSGLGQVGVAFLLFLVGIEIKIEDLPSVGRVSVITGIGQIVFTSIVGFVISTVFGFNFVQSLYIAVALTFSSTIIIVKLLSQKRTLGSLYGKISLGFLLIQDVVAVLILSVLAGIGSTGAFDPVGIVIVLVKSVLILLLVAYMARWVMPKLFTRYLSGNAELTFIVSIAWALGFSTLVSNFGLTYEIGGFLAGLALSNVASHLLIASHTKPLRDFFLTIFFILLGANMSIHSGVDIVLPALAFSLFVLIGNPLIVFVLLKLQGYTKRVSFFSGLTVAQISEFSFILVATGLTLGHLNEQIVSLVILVGIITMTVSTYMIIGSEKIYPRIKKYLSFMDFAKEKNIEQLEELEISDHIIVVGADKSGMTLIKYLVKSKYKYAVVDFNPEIHKRLKKRGINAVFADITDEETLTIINFPKAKLFVSTVPNLYVNLFLLNYRKLSRSNLPMILTASTKHEAKILYDMEASYVIIPEESAGEHLKHILKVYKTSEAKLNRLGGAHERKISR